MVTLREKAREAEETEVIENSAPHHTAGFTAEELALVTLLDLPTSRRIEITLGPKERENFDGPTSFEDKDDNEECEGCGVKPSWVLADGMGIIGLWSAEIIRGYVHWDKGGSIKVVPAPLTPDEKKEYDALTENGSLTDEEEKRFWVLDEKRSAYINSTTKTYSPLKDAIAHLEKSVLDPDKCPDAATTPALDPVLKDYEHEDYHVYKALSILRRLAGIPEEVA